MEKEIKAVFNDRIIEAGAQKFGIAAGELCFIGAWQSFIYEYQNKGKSYILRFTPSSHRSESLIKGELDWVRYLADHGVSVSRPIPSKQGNLTETVKAAEDLTFTAAAFVKAKGRKIGYPECLNDTDLYQRLGQFTGTMHALAKQYEPNDSACKRSDWSQNYYLANVEKFVPSSQSRIYESKRKLVAAIKDRLSKAKHSYGLIHGDIGVGNYVVNDAGELTLFDFDEAQYSWFVEDIAVPLYYLVYVYGGDEGKKDREAQAFRFMEHFMKGYLRENAMDESWLKYIPLFLQLREIIVYTGMHRSSDMLHLNAWAQDYLAQSKVRIEQGIPIVDIWG